MTHVLSNILSGGLVLILLVLWHGRTHTITGKRRCLHCGDKLRRGFVGCKRCGR